MIKTVVCISSSLSSGSNNRNNQLVLGLRMVQEVTWGRTTFSRLCFADEDIARSRPTSSLETELRHRPSLCMLRASSRGGGKINFPPGRSTDICCLGNIARPTGLVAVGRGSVEIGQRWFLFRHTHTKDSSILHNIFNLSFWDLKDWTWHLDCEKKEGRR